MSAFLARKLLRKLPKQWGAHHDSITAAAPDTRKPLYTSLFVQVLQHSCSASCSGWPLRFCVGLKIFSDAFLKLISMIVAPIVFCVVVHGIAGAGDLKRSDGSASRRWSISK